ncbi:histidine acid phosphatase [Tritrichomonas foetus]|uniref:Histidine acid phosphatase n=1 Tax=Tritrichomonas foetus TaxID=1144522 RepID=A0A1J4JL46_9EUKA|nr:histidine acid phosphatase [Tritrichomonas foetus]|eukprot:OHS97988.1 histidine acid phosphatase [Tritrichomonas foetus]
MVNSTIPCSGPLRLPIPVKGATLLSLFLFTRHGARAPADVYGRADKIGNWSCGTIYSKFPLRRIPIVNSEILSNFYEQSPEKVNFPPLCQNGQLTDLGVEQHENLGKLYRKYLIDETHLLSNEFNPNEIYLRTSFIQRCIESSLNLLHGMYPPNKDENLYINITTGAYMNEPLCPYHRSTPKFKELTVDFLKTPEFLERKRFLDNYKINIFKVMNITNIKHDEIMYLFPGDFLNCYRCSNQELPLDESQNEIDDVLFAQLMSNMAFYEAGYFKFVGNLAYQPIFQLMDDEIEKILTKQKQTKFTLFSGHDTTLSAILVGLGYDDLIAPPPFASHLAVELWLEHGEHYLRFVYNGDIIDYQGKRMIPLDEFRKCFIKEKIRNSQEEHSDEI